MILHLNELIESSGLYKEAFTHKSLNKSQNFERLEFLGDSLIGLLITELLYLRYPKTSEGDLSRWRSALVGQGSLAELCRQLQMNEKLICKKTEYKSLYSNERIQASLFESFIGAYYLDRGFKEVKSLVSQLFERKIEEAQTAFSTADFKTLFQEAAQAYLGATPTYQTLEKTGPAHSPHFKVGVCINSEIYAKADGESIKSAQKAAAEKALAKLNKNQDTSNIGEQS